MTNMIIPPKGKVEGPPSADRAFTGPLPAGTRLVLEVPDANAPAGYRVELPDLDAFAEMLTPRIVRFAALARAARQAAEEPPPAPAAITPPPAMSPPAMSPPEPTVCQKCGLPKTALQGGRMMCKPCQAQAVTLGHARRNGRAARQAQEGAV